MRRQGSPPAPAPTMASRSTWRWSKDPQGLPQSRIHGQRRVLQKERIEGHAFLPIPFALIDWKERINDASDEDGKGHRQAGGEIEERMRPRRLPCQITRQAQPPPPALNKNRGQR